MFEEVIEKIIGESSWKHEMTTLKLFDRMFETESMKSKTTLKQEFESYGLFDDDIQFIKDLIYCPSLKELTGGLSYDDKVTNIKIVILWLIRTRRNLGILFSSFRLES